MEEEDIILIDEDGQQRNAVIVDRRSGRQGQGNRQWGNTRPTWGNRHYATATPAHVPQRHYPQQQHHHPQAHFPQPAASTKAPASLATGLKSWVGDIVHILAAVTAAPTAPVLTGTQSVDASNMLAYQEAVVAAMKRAQLLHTVGGILSRRLA